MNIEEYRDYCMSLKGATESTPFPKLQNILVFKVGGKMFSATDLNTFESISIKCEPETIEELRGQYPAMKEPSYFSKNHWSSVLMDGTIPDQTIHSWLEISYNLVYTKLTKKIKEEIDGLY